MSDQTYIVDQPSSGSAHAMEMTPQAQQPVEAKETTPEVKLGLRGGRDRGFLAGCLGALCLCCACEGCLDCIDDCCF